MDVNMQPGITTNYSRAGPAWIENVTYDVRQ